MYYFIFSILFYYYFIYSVYQGLSYQLGISLLLSPVTIYYHLLISIILVLLYCIVLYHVLVTKIR